MQSPRFVPVRQLLAAGGLLLALAAALALAACSGQSSNAMAAKPQPPFGGPDDSAFAATLWASLEHAHLVGDETIHTTPYKGKPPHGDVLETLDSDIAVQGRTADVIVKKNYRGEGLTPMQVANDPDRFLKSVTVMFWREAGYDPEDGNIFWVKYNPDGSLQKNPKGMRLAGRVAKGAPQGCIACHKAAPGGDMVYNHDRYARR